VTGVTIRPGQIADVVALHRSLTTTVSMGHGVNGIATVLHEATGGTVVIDDADGTRLAQVGALATDDLRLPDRCCSEPRDHACAFRIGEWVIVVASPGGTCLGVIGMLDPEGLADGTALFALEQGTMVLATEMFRLRSVASNELRVWGDLASELLDNPDIDRSRSHAAVLGYVIDRPHRALVIEADLPGPLPSMTELHHVFRAAGLDGRLSASRANNLVCFVADDADWTRLGAELSREGHRQLRLGVGDRHDPPDLSLSVAEGELALRLSAARVVRFDGLGISRFLSTDADQTRLRAFVDEWLGALTSYDDSHGSDLVHTLSESLRDQHSLRATSDRLHVHPSTLKYRLRRIEELSGRDLHDPDDRFNLDLACRVRATLEAQEVSAAHHGTRAVDPDLVGSSGLVMHGAALAAASSAVEVGVLDCEGVLTSVNRAWREFSTANGGDPDRSGVGTSYVDVCTEADGDPWADMVGSAVHLAIDGDLPAPVRFTIPCHSPDTSRWFEMSVSSRYDDEGSCCGATVTLIQTTTH
jgi:sugar diacid utilization regulator